MLKYSWVARDKPAFAVDMRLFGQMADDEPNLTTWHPKSCGLFVTLGCVARVSGRKTGAKAIEIIAIIAVGSLVKTLLKPLRFGRYSHIAG